MSQALFNATVFAQILDGSGHMDWDNGWWLIMMLGMVLFWAAVVVGLVWLVRESSQGRSTERDGEEPSEVLQRRLAEGQISVEEYDKRRRALVGAAPTEGAGGQMSPAGQRRG